MLYKINIKFFFRHDESGMQMWKHKDSFNHYTNLEEEGENTERVSLRSVHCVAVVGIRVLQQEDYQIRGLILYLNNIQIDIH